jgi:tRNA pseudouridine55 synthase
MLTAEDYKNGQVLLIDKPLKWTSFQAVNKIRWHIRQKFNIKKIKVGHAGTLDPLASGLLIICTGNFTKKIDEFQGQIKEYTGEITLGSTTPSYDMETEVNETFSLEHITEDLIQSTVKQFIGDIDQKPPIFSALKKDGVRMYDLAREGKTVEINSRKINIAEFEITKIDLPKIKFRVVCSKGTYIRSLAYDFGKALNSGGYLSELRRTKIGDFNVDYAAEPLAYIEKYLNNEVI